MERVLDGAAIICDNHHSSSSPKKWREAVLSFYSCSQTFIDVFQANEEKSIRRLQEKFAEEQKRICQTMG